MFTDILNVRNYNAFALGLVALKPSLDSRNATFATA
jgi:hypothetical protein